MENIQLYLNDLTSSAWGWGSISINLACITVLLIMCKFLMGWISNVSVHDEIANQDNNAFGIKIGLTFFSFFLVMSGASMGDGAGSVASDIILSIGYGVSGMFMLIASMVFFDKFTMSQFCFKTEIRAGNMSAAVVDGGNVLASALVIMAYMSWVSDSSFEPITLIIYGWLVSQALLSIFSVIRAKLYVSINGKTLYDAIKEDNMAVALRYTSYKLSFALTAFIAVPHYPYISGDGWWSATAILVSSVILCALLKVVTAVTKRIIFLNRIDFSSEVNVDGNIGVSVIECCILLGTTFLAYGLLK